MTARSTSRCLHFPEIRDRLIVLERLVEDLGDDRLAHGLVGLAESRLYDKVRKLAVNCWSCVNAPTQYAGIAAIDGPQDAVDEDGRRLRPPPQGRGRGAERAAGRFLHHAEGRVLRLPQHRETGWKAKTLASALLEEAGVALIGGPDFGVLGEGYIRLSYANSEENILRALDRIGNFLASRKAA